MKKEDIKTIGSLFEDALGLFKNEVNKRFNAMEAHFGRMEEGLGEVKIDVGGMKRLMVEHFTETDTKIEKIVEAMQGFLKLHLSFGNK